MLVHVQHSLLTHNRRMPVACSSSAAREPRARREHDSRLVGPSAERVAAAPLGIRASRGVNKRRVDPHAVLVALRVLSAHHRAAHHCAQVPLASHLRPLLREPVHGDSRGRHGARVHRCAQFASQRIPLFTLRMRRHPEPVLYSVHKLLFTVQHSWLSHVL